MSERKIAIVTGANSGIGLETAVGLAKHGMLVVLACRDLDKAKAAKEAVERAVPGAAAEPAVLDLGSQSSIRAFVDAFTASHPALHVLVNNAATVPSSRALSPDGFEMQFGVNHLGPFLLTRLLLPSLRSGAPSRVVVLSSSVYKGARIDFEDLQSERAYSTMKVYSATKLMNMLLVRSLARRLEGTGVTINGVHPGVVSTALARDFPLPFRVMARLFFASPAKGAKTSVFVATSPSLDGVTGGYFAGSKAEALDKAALDDAAAERLWSVSSALCGQPVWPVVQLAA